MKTVVLYYSYSGKTRVLAQKYAGSESADIVEIKDVVRPGKFRAYTTGIGASRRGDSWQIQPLSVDWTLYDRIKIFSPVWAGNPVPTINAALGQLPQGKKVSVTMVSASGKSDCKARIEAAIKSRGSVLDGFENVKG